MFTPQSSSNVFSCIFESQPGQQLKAFRWWAVIRKVPYALTLSTYCLSMKKMLISLRLLCNHKLR